MAVAKLLARRVILPSVAAQQCIRPSLVILPWRLNPSLRTYATEASSQVSQSHDSGPPPPPPSSSSTSRSPSTSSKSSNSHSSSASSSASSSSSSSSTSASNRGKAESTEQEPVSSLPSGWEDDPDFNISGFDQLPHKHFGFNQHMIVNAEFKEALRQVLWKFRAPIRYAFAYGSGVFPQSSSGPSATPHIHPNPPEAVTKWQTSGQKSIDFIFGVSFTQHWHSLNLQQHRDHYSFLGSLGSGLISRIQDRYGAGAYFHPYIIVNGIMIKYGVVNLDTLYQDLSEWNTMYFAGRLHKPVKILRDDPRIRLANQVNLISALRTALLMLPPEFTEHDLYTKIASISYMGDPRMAFRAESPRKVANIVDHQMANFRQLYLPLIHDLPNIHFNDPDTKKDGWTERADLNVKLYQDMDKVRRGNMVRRLPKNFRRHLYAAYQAIYRLPAKEYRAYVDESKDESTFSSSQGGEFDRRIASEPNLGEKVEECVKRIINRPSLSEAVKGVLTAGVAKSWRYVKEKRAKAQVRSQDKDPQKGGEKKDSKKEKDAEDAEEKEINRDINT